MLLEKEYNVNKVERERVKDGGKERRYDVQMDTTFSCIRETS